MTANCHPSQTCCYESDPETASALRRLPDRDFSRINGREWDNVAAGEIVARAHRQLLQEIGEDGQQVIIDRATSLGVAPSTLASFVQSLSPQFVMEASRRWFDLVSASGDPDVRQVEFQDLATPPASILLAARPNDDLLTNASSDDLLLAPAAADNDLLDQPSSGDRGLLGGDLLGGDLLGGVDDDLLNSDPLAQDPLASDKNFSAGRSERFNADKMMPAGGWYRDDLRLAIRYRGGGHEDRVLKSTIEMISQLPSGDPARQQLLQTRAVAACVACHPGAAISGRGWRSESLIGRKSEFTKFSHSPHLNVAQLADCSHCHSLGSDSNTGIEPSQRGCRDSRFCSAATSGMCRLPHPTCGR